MGGRRLDAGPGVDALEEAIDLIRALWDADERGGVQVDGQLLPAGAAPSAGPAPAHRVGIWIGAYKPRMLALTGRQGRRLAAEPVRTWRPATSRPATRAIDEAAVRPGRDPAAIRRLLNLSPPEGPLDRAAGRSWPAGARGRHRHLHRDGRRPRHARRRSPTEVAPAVRELAACASDAASPAEPRRAGADARRRPSDRAAPTSEYARLGVTPDPRRRHAPDRRARPGTSRPARTGRRPARTSTYTRRGRAVGQHLIDVHDMLRGELTELRDVVAQVRDGALGAGDARSALNEMALRQNDWTLGAFCARYCARSRSTTGSRTTPSSRTSAHDARSSP